MLNRKIVQNRHALLIVMEHFGRHLFLSILIEFTGRPVVHSFATSKRRTLWKRKLGAIKPQLFRHGPSPASLSSAGQTFLRRTEYSSLCLYFILFIFIHHYFHLRIESFVRPFCVIHLNDFTYGILRLSKSVERYLSKFLHSLTLFFVVSPFSVGTAE
jgi:hypothetical protein